MTNDSARGYIVMTLKNLGYKEDEIDKILDELHLQFDTITEYEAEQYYYSGAWKKWNISQVFHLEKIVWQCY